MPHRSIVSMDGGAVNSGPPDPPDTGYRPGVVWPRARGSAGRRRGRLIGSTAVAGVVAAALALAGCSESAGRVGVRLTDGNLVLRFRGHCSIAYLRLSAFDDTTKSVASPAFWEIRAKGKTAPVSEVTAGQPPDGFVAVSDRLPPAWSGTVQLFVTTPGTYNALIDTSSLADGAEHEYPLTPVMHEGVRPGPPPC
jgi:hypothetical protein